ncbi:hypothetical protein GIB67_031531 [Kingdonia uniflora]|uniref:Uncharacterized protein n=1 Tax=Kingdonia uniflora TaxID=39325 RepID=A0A7J7PBL2_9MAGN|nr:hypothetical protein GIB67_031531 [Kingdonia uniflora]
MAATKRGRAAASAEADARGTVPSASGLGGSNILEESHGLQTPRENDGGNYGACLQTLLIGRRNMVSSSLVTKGRSLIIRRVYLRLLQSSLLCLMIS